jgi:hypothetical protein
MPRYCNPGRVPVTIEVSKPTRRLIIVQPRDVKSSLVPPPKEAVSEIELDGETASQFVRMQMLQLITEKAPEKAKVAPVALDVEPAEMVAAGAVAHPSAKKEPAVTEKKKYGAPSAT